MAEAKEMYGDGKVSVGEYLSLRLLEAGVQNFFTVPGDYNMLLLDEMMKVESLKLIGCCNELNASFAADGYARSSKTLGVAVVTFMVGALSSINAVAGAFSDDLPFLIVVGSPNTHDVVEGKVVHHTLGYGGIQQCQHCFAPVTCNSFVVHSLKDAAGKIDNAILAAVSKKKPVYLEIPCNLSNLKIAPPVPAPTLHSVISARSEASALHFAVQAVANRIEEVEEVVVLLGSKANVDKVMLDFIKRIGCAVAVMPDAKGQYCEMEEQFVGCYWGAVSSPYTKKVVEDSGLILLVGPLFSDYSTVGWTTNIHTDKSVIIAPDHVHLSDTRYSFVYMTELITHLAKCVPSKKTSLLKFKELSKRNEREQSIAESDNLSIGQIKQVIQDNIQSCANLVVDSGDSWFIGMTTKLGEEIHFHIQMQYGSIGWSLPATLGIALHAKNIRRGKTLLIIGDGAFQVTVQELSTIIRENLNVMVLIINNGSYTIEDQIHPGPYNKLVNWDYTKMVECFKGSSQNVASFKISTNDELRSIMGSEMKKEGVSVLECCVTMGDCTGELKIWGEHVAASNKRN